MSTENEKLLQIKKSCKGVKTVSQILLIISIVAFTLSVFMGIFFIAGSSKIDPILHEAESDGTLDIKLAFKGIQIGAVELPDPDDWSSSVPAIQQKFDEGSYSFIFGTYLFIISGAILTTIVILCLIRSIFNIILKEETPFCDKVIKRLLITLIVATVFIGLTIGWGFAILAGFVTWGIITIMEYGKQLQLQSDETL
ncbi:MAG: hypothetical protein K5988_11260 [Lachnospiraceae bacterium]|nr:hypothetical protein [Lachnospiraceae bacterium]